MSFVHCSSCHRAYDLRRSVGCPSCRQKAAAAEAAETARVAELAAAEAAALEAAAVEAARLEAAKLEAAKLEAKLEAAKLESARLADEAELVEAAAEPFETAEAVEVGPAAHPQAAGDELTAYRAAPREDRIVAMVEELAALLEGASTVELEAAQQKLQQRGLRAPWTAQLTSGGRFLLAAGSQLVTQAIRAPQQGARKLARRLRDAWSGNSPRA